MEPSRFRGVYLSRGNLYTRRLAGGSVYGEKIVEIKGELYREWNPWRSKLAAAIKNGLKELPIERDSRVLYLGAASGTTASHVSDLCPDGMVFCVEISPRAFRDLLGVCRERPNMFPLEADARHPMSYMAVVGAVDFIYQDIAQRDQDKVFMANAEMLLRRGGRALLMLKARSVSSSERPEETFRRVLASLEASPSVKVTEKIRLEPYHRDHLALGIQWKG
ncbi:MAG: fibrillarin-like rRNA/tRNA 2'-O-methyltransferase [Thermoplasmata archaeon]